MRPTPGSNFVRCALLGAAASLGCAPTGAGSSTTSAASSSNPYVHIDRQGQPHPVTPTTSTGPVSITLAPVTPLTSLPSRYMLNELGDRSTAGQREATPLGLVI